MNENIIKRVLNDANSLEMKCLLSVPELTPDHSETFNKKMTELFKVSRDREAICERVRRRKRLALAIAVSVIITLLLVSCVYIINLAEYDIKYGEGFMDFDSDQGADLEVFIYYSPTYLPEGFNQRNKKVDENRLEIRWTDADRKIEYLQGNINDASFSFSTDFTEYSIIQINGNEAHYYDRGKTKSVIWTKDGMYFFFRFDFEISYDEVIKVLSSNMPVRNNKP